MRTITWNFVTPNGTVLSYRLGNKAIIRAFCTMYPNNWVSLV